MIVSALITTLRERHGDLPEKHRDIETGDGTATVYKTKFSPVLEGSYKVYVAGSLKTEGVSSDYTLDKDTGDIVFASAPSGEVRVQYQSVSFRDSWWLNTIRSSIHALGDKYFRTVIRTTSSMALSADVQKYPCPSGCTRLIEVLESDDYTTSGNFTPLKTNHWYDRRSNTLILGGKPTRANYLAVSFTRSVNAPSTTSGTLDIENNWQELLELKSGAIFLRAKAAKIAQQGNVSVEEGHLSVQAFRMLSNDYMQDFDRLAARNKPVMPSYVIPYHIPGGGDVQTP